MNYFLLSKTSKLLLHNKIVSRRTSNMKFYIDTESISYTLPGGIIKPVQNLGILAYYKGKTYSESEINSIIGSFFKYIPYIPGSMEIKIPFMYETEENSIGCHHVICLKNYDYQNQTFQDAQIKFLK